MESCLVILIVGVIMMCIFEYVAWSQLVVKYVLLRSSHPCHDLTRVMRRTHFSKLSSYSSKNRRLVRGMSGLTVREIKLIYYCFGYWLLQLFWAIVAVFCLLLEWNIYGRFFFFFWCCFFQVTKDTSSWNGFLPTTDHNTPRFSETMLGKLGTCFSFFFSVSVVVVVVFFSLWRSKMQQQKKPFYIDSSAFCC